MYVNSHALSIRYERSFAYWQKVPATNDGVLGGFINVASSVRSRATLPR